jgi:hypothetical protein
MKLTSQERSDLAVALYVAAVIDKSLPEELQKRIWKLREKIDREVETA